MPVIMVTRLRLRSPAFFDEFVASAVAVVEQAKNSAGNLGADVLAEANNTYWTRTAWQERDYMDAFVGNQPHLKLWAAWATGAMRPPSLTGSNLARICRTGRRGAGGRAPRSTGSMLEARH